MGKPINASKWLLGALGITLCAKAATSFPVLPRPGETQFVTFVAAPAEEPAAQSDKEVPPIVEGLVSDSATCEAPEEVMQAILRERELLAEQKQKFEARKSEIALAREALDIERQAILELRNSLESLLAKVEAAQTDDLKTPDRVLSEHEAGGRRADHG